MDKFDTMRQGLGIHTCCLNVHVNEPVPKSQVTERTDSVVAH